MDEYGWKRLPEHHINWGRMNVLHNIALLLESHMRPESNTNFGCQWTIAGGRLLRDHHGIGPLRAAAQQRCAARSEKGHLLETWWSSGWCGWNGHFFFIEGGLEVKLPTIYGHMKKQRWEESEKRKIRKKIKSRRERVRRKKMQMREKVGKSRNTVFFQWFVAPEGRKVGSLKRRVRSHLARWEMKNCTPFWRDANFQVKMYSDHFWKLRRWKSARRCGAKHTLKSKCTKHTNIEPLLEVEMSKKCTPLWREAHSEVKTYKAQHAQSTFGSWDVESTFGSEKCKKNWQSRTTFES